MTAAAFQKALALYGPSGQQSEAPTRAEARAYCRHLARSHYENFTVASWLLPRDLRPHFYHIYGYCRWADDLADETGNVPESLELLAWWERQLRACYRGQVQHPVFVALSETIEEFNIPPDPFCDLLVAFRRDQRQTRYASFAELLTYCQHSANPVGRLILYLGRCHNDTNVAWSDSICTGLQLANFLQDIARDYDRGRIYLPVESWHRFGYSKSDFAERVLNDSFRNMVKFEVDRAQSYLRAGVPLVKHVPRRFAVDVDLFIRGGLSLLKAIRRSDYNVWQQRPTVNKWKKIGLLMGAWWTAKAKRRH